MAAARRRSWRTWAAIARFPGSLRITQALRGTLTFPGPDALEYAALGGIATRYNVNECSACTKFVQTLTRPHLRVRQSSVILKHRIGRARLRSVKMSYRPLALAAAIAALSAMHIASAAAQSVYVAPGGIYIGAGAGPVYVTPGAPTNGAAAYVAPGYGAGYGTAAYEEPGYGYGYGPVVPNRRYYSGPRSAYAAALPPRPRLAVPYRTGRRH